MNISKKDIDLIILDDEYHCFSVKKDLESFPVDMMQRIKEKLNEIVEDEQFKFKTMVLKLILGHEYAFENDCKQAYQIFEELECELKLLDEIGCDVPFFNKIKKSFLNMIRTCKMYVLISQNDAKKAREILPTIQAFTNLDETAQASVFGIRSMVYLEYGLCGHKIALEYAEKAKKMDPRCPYWHFLIGKVLGRIRRVEKPYDIPSHEERTALETAINIEENHLFMLFTAEAYVETSTRTYRFHVRNQNLYPSLKVKIDQLNEEASNLYKKCIEMQPNCSHVLFRSAKGFLNLPHPQKDVERAKELLLKGLKSNPRNPFANHLLARYYERYASNIPEAIKRLKICSEQNVFGADMDLMRLEYTIYRNSKETADKLEKLLEKYVEVPRKHQLLTQLASYYIFMGPDLSKACDLLKQAIIMNYDDNILNHRSIFLRTHKPFSILDVLVDELKKQMENKYIDSQLKDTYESFIFSMNDSNVPITKGRAKNLKADILKEDEDIRSGKYRKNNDHTNGRRIRRRSYQKTIPISTGNQSIEKAQSVKKLDEFFDSWMNDVNKGQNQHKKESGKRTDTGKNSLNESFSNISTASDSRYSSTRRNGYDRYRNSDRYHKRNNDSEDLEFDRISTLSQDSRDQPNFSKSKRYENGEENLTEDFDRLSLSSRNSDNRPASSKGRGARQFQSRGDFNRNKNNNRDRGRHNNSNAGYSSNNRIDFNGSNGRGCPNQHNRQSTDRFDRHSSNISKNSQNDDSFDQISPSKSPQSKSNFGKRSTENFDNDDSASPGNSPNKTYTNRTTASKSGQNKSGRISRENESFDRTRNQDSSKYRNTKITPDDSDSDEDLMSYFRKK